MGNGLPSKKRWKYTAVGVLAMILASTILSCGDSDETPFEAESTPEITGTQAGPSTPSTPSAPSPTETPGIYDYYGVTPASPTPTPTPPAPSPTPSAPAELKVVSNLNVGAGPENITDVWALVARTGKSYAYLGTYDQPSCTPETSGVHIVDITDPARPSKAGFISTPGFRVSDVMAKHIETNAFSGDLLVFSVEFCSSLRSQRQLAESPAIMIYDVTDPLAPRRLAPDFSLGFEAHNAFFYQDRGHAYVLIVRDNAERDFVMVDITNPSAPVQTASRGRPDWFGPDDQMAIGAFPAAFHHDLWAQSYPTNHPNPNYAGKTIAYLSYWDAGLVILDVTDPANPVFVGDSDYVNPDPVSGKTPEGNSHTTVPTEDGNLVFMGDEDFSPSPTLFNVDSGAFARNYRAVEATFTKPINDLEGQMLIGQTVFVGRANTAAETPPPRREAAAPGTKFIALIERGDVTFEEKMANAASAGYDAAIVFGSLEAPDQLIPMTGATEKGTIPALFVARSTAFAIMGIRPDSPATTALPGVGTTGERITARTTFDGWGYGRVLDVRDPRKIVELGQFATPGSMQNPPLPGDHSIHNVVLDGQRAYISWYADGVWVVDFTLPAKPVEVAHFVDKAAGSDFWGVYLFKHPNGRSYILGSDRSTGLWIFEAP